MPTIGPKKRWKHAEDTFRLLCDDFGATCNKAYEDEHGWDFFVEFPAENPNALALDLVRPGPKCLVQVKSTRTRATTCKMKLSNALDFARSDLPCFVVMFRYPDDKKQPEVSLRHFWEPEIRRALEDARKLDSAGTSHPNREVFRIPSNDMRTFGSENLLQTIKDTIVANGPNYGAKKTLIFDTVGFEDTFASGKISYAEGVKLEDIVDLYIGLKQELATSHFEWTSVRFGVPATRPTVSVTRPGIVRVEQEPKPAKIVISSENLGIEIRLDAEGFVPGIPDLDPALHKARFVSDFIELVVYPHQNKFDYKLTWDASAPLPLTKLKTLVNLLSLCGEAITLEVKWQDKRLLSGDGTFPTTKGKAQILEFQTFF